MTGIATSCPKPVVKFPLVRSSGTWQFESDQPSPLGIQNQNSEFWDTGIDNPDLDSWEMGTLEVRIERRWELMAICSFSGKRPSVSIENEKSEYAEISPSKPKEWFLLWRQDSCVFGRSGGDGEKKLLLGGQLSETETSKSGNMSEVLRRNPSKKTSEIRRTFVFTTSTPARAAVTSENKHSICDIFSEYFLLKHFCTIYIFSQNYL